MSSIAFHTIGETVRVSGRERAAMGLLCFEFLRTHIGNLEYDNLEWLSGVTTPGHYLHDDALKLSAMPDGLDKNLYKRRTVESFWTYLRGGSNGGIAINGEPVDLFCLQLNSAISWGNRAVQFAAKLHGQCEIHAWCDGHDRAWLADLIDEAVSCGVFRHDPCGYKGWPAVSELLRSSDGGEVVTSYSVCDSFPNPGLVPDGAFVVPEDSDEWDLWSEFSEEQRWAWGMDALRGKPGLQISPDRLGVLFNDGLTGREFMKRAIDRKNKM